MNPFESRIFVVDTQGNREELELESPIIRVLKRSIEERQAREAFERWLDENLNR